MRMKDLIEQIKQQGPDRILINEDGDAVSPRRTSIVPDVIFIRKKDQWSLGAPNHLVALAFGMWEDEWEFALLPPKKLLKIDHFVYLMDRMILISNKQKLN
jgi:hypothetical protein